MALTADQLNTIYQNVLFRNVDAGGIQFYANRTDISDAQVRQQIELSPEASSFVSPIVRLYQEVLGRVPDQGGLRFFSTQLRAGQSLDNIAQQLINSSEFASKSTATNGAVDATDLTNTNQLVSDAFQSILGRTPASSEFQFFQGKSAAQILSAVAGSSEAASTNAAATVSFLDSVAQGSYPTGTLNNQTGGANGGTNAGTTYALTTGSDNIPGTAANDTINGVVDNGNTANSTISAADVINGGAGTNILNVTAVGTPAGAPATFSVLNGASVSNIQGIQVRNTDASAAGANAATLDASTTPGLTFFNSNLSTGDVAITSAANGLAVGIIGNGIITNGAVSAGYVASATTANVTYANGTSIGAGTNGVTITGSGLTSATVNSIGAANTSGTLTLATGITSLNINAATDLTLSSVSDANLATITASGAATKGVSLGTLGAGVKTVDASGLTAGGVTATLDAALTSFKGGQGSDVITTATLTSTTAGIVDGGAGTDVLVVASTIDTATKGAQYVNFETLRVSGSQDVSLISGITSVQVNAATSATISNLTATQAGAITVRGDQATNLTLQLASTSGSSDVVGLTLNNPTATSAVPADVDIVGLKIAGVETLNITSLGGGTDLTSAGTLNSVSFGTGGADVLSSIKITGTSSLDLDATNTAVAVNIDASGLTGSAALKFAGALVQGSVLTGSSNADTVTASTVAGSTGQFVTYNLGAGNDTINTTTAALATNTAGIKIDGGAGTDVLNFTDSGTATLSDNNFQFVTNVETITHAVNGAATNITTGGFFNTNFGTAVTFNLGTTTTGAAQSLDASAYTGVATVNVSNTGTGTSTVSTGSGADVITVSAAGSTGAVTVTAGAGNDTITVNSGSTTSNGATVTGGTGTDTINFGTTVNTSTANVQHVIINAGDSVVSSTAADSITNFKLADGTARSGHLDFAGTGTVAADVNASSVSGFSSAQLTISITNGIATFAGSSASTLTVDQKAAALQSTVTSGLDTAAFVDSGNTYVFHNDAAGDSLVKLVGVAAASVTATLTTTTADALAIS